MFNDRINRIVIGLCVIVTGLVGLGAIFGALIF